MTKQTTPNHAVGRTANTTWRVSTAAGGQTALYTDRHTTAAGSWCKLRAMLLLQCGRKVDRCCGGNLLDTTADFRSVHFGSGCLPIEA